MTFKGDSIMNKSLKVYKCLDYKPEHCSKMFMQDKNVEPEDWFIEDEENKKVFFVKNEWIEAIEDYLQKHRPVRPVGSEPLVKQIVNDYENLENYLEFIEEDSVENGAKFYQVKDETVNYLFSDRQDALRMAKRLNKV